jgi:ABC-type branched-subunit amino acid transport system substrate-binding protein
MQQSSRSKMWVVGLVAASLTVLSMLVMAQTSTRVIKIGILAPLSGNSAADGEEMVRGAQLAVKELNAAGGVAGYRFEVVSGDTKDQTPALSSASPVTKTYILWPPGTPARPISRLI